MRRRNNDIKSKKRFTEAQMEEAFNDGDRAEQERCGYLNVNNYLEEDATKERKLNIKIK